ncbi:hypothetical protein [Thermobrachium celere]|uniref:hypothetical protein n=1 Tax=Thermobrachium celere TaxID=53422 RepID=UPI00194353A9|nr:hypothetical protein [Thermobrachium celere]GFR36054.1 hypothetical protein TCEA9_18660 [Thermobrachium celere]
MTNLQRLKMEIPNISFSDVELDVFLQENGLNAEGEYNPDDSANYRAILKTALSILEAVANDVNLMKNFKLDDMSVMDFHSNLMERISYLDRKIRNILDDDTPEGAVFTYLFSD